VLRTIVTERRRTHLQAAAAHAKPMPSYVRSELPGEAVETTRPPSALASERGVVDWP
jgi:hypothetical protein